jgi:First Longin domain of INTU, CCZ1 and HPS4
MNFPPSLSNFFVFDQRLGTKEGTEEQKILFFHPQQLKVEDKTNYVGLCEGIIQFTRYANVLVEIE